MNIRLSEAELEVMEVLWAASQPLGATDVAERIPPQRQWTLATVKTLLSRLLAKQAIAPAKDGRRFLYTAMIERDIYVGAESRRFVSRLFGGRLSPLIAQMAEGEALDATDIADIEALLKRLKS
ncbi:MAG: BlaI/MecI/CopY family transcriptional regulator [Sphingomicrobium sp.]